MLTNNAYVPYITEVAMECELNAMINNAKYTDEEVYALTFVKNIFVQSFINHNADALYNLCSYQCFPDVRSKINNIMQDVLYKTI